jgi:hypothetical protein
MREGIRRHGEAYNLLRTGMFRDRNCEEKKMLWMMTYVGIDGHEKTVGCYTSAEKAVGALEELAMLIKQDRETEITMDSDAPGQVDGMRIMIEHLGMESLETEILMLDEIKSDHLYPVMVSGDILTTKEDGKIGYYRG